MSYRILQRSIIGLAAVISISIAEQPNDNTTTLKDVITTKKHGGLTPSQASSIANLDINASLAPLGAGDIFPDLVLHIENRGDAGVNVINPIEDLILSFSDQSGAPIQLPVRISGTFANPQIPSGPTLFSMLRIVFSGKEKSGNFKTIPIAAKQNVELVIRCQKVVVDRVLAKLGKGSNAKQPASVKVFLSLMDADRPGDSRNLMSGNLNIPLVKSK